MSISIQHILKTFKEGLEKEAVYRQYDDLGRDYHAAIQDVEAALDHTINMIQEHVKRR